MVARPKPPRRWTRILRRCAVAAVLLVAIAVPLVKFWLAPSLIRSAVTAAVGRRWNGRVALREVQFNFFAPIRLRGFRVDGPDGRRWAEIDEVRAVLRDWPGISPVLTAVEADRVRLDLHWAGGRLALPIRPAGEEAESIDAGKYVDLRRITVAAFDVALHHGDDRTEAPTLGVSVVRERGRYRFRLAPPAAAKPSLEGYFDPAAGFRGRLRLTRDLTPAECALLAGCAGLDAAGSGALDADLTVAAEAGRLRNAAVEGKVRLRGWSLRAGGESLCNELSADVDFLGDTARLTQLTARTPGGTITATGKAALPLGRPLDYDLEVTADEVPLALLRGPGGRAGVTGGTARGTIRVRGRGLETMTLAGTAAVNVGLNLGPLRGATGEAEFNATVAGPLNDPAKLRIQGRCDLRRWSCRDDRGELASADSTRVQFDGDRFTIPDFRLRLGRARLTVAGSATLGRGDTPIQYQATVRTDAPADLEELARRLPVTLPAGTVEVDVTARGSGAEELRLAGSCTADLRPGFWRLHKAAGRVKFDVAVTDLAKPDRAAVRGWGQVVGRLEAPDAALAQKVSARLSLTGRSADISQLVIDTPGGRIAGSARAAWPVGGTLAYTASLQSAGLDAAPIAKAVGLAGWRGQGKVATRAILRGSTSGMAVGGEATLVGAAGDYGLRLVEGGLAYDLKAAWAGDAARGLTGSVRLRNCHLATAGDVDVKGLDGVLTISPDAINLVSASGGTPWGRVEAAAGRLVLSPRTLRASATLKRWDLAGMIRHFEPGSPLRGGPADLRATVAITGDTLRVTAGGGATARYGALPARGGGTVSADVTVAHFDRPARRSMTGKARLAGWRIEGAAGRVLDDLALTAAFDRRTIHISELTARTARGQLRAAGRIDLPPDAPPRYAGTVHVSGLDIPAAISLVRTASPVKSGELSLSGSFSGQGADSLALRARGACRLGGALGPARQAGGAYALDVQLTGPLAEADRLAVRGTGRLSEWRVVGAGGPIAEKVGVSVLMLGRGADVSSLRGRLAGGRIVGRARLDFEPRKPLRYGGGLTLRDVNVSRLAASLGQRAKEELGLLQARYSFQGQGGDPDNIRGAGAVALGHSRAHRQAAMRALLQRLGVAPARAGRFDVRAAFAHRGPAVTISHARLATPALAMVVQPGGTADLRTREMNLYVIAAVLHDIDQFFGKVPVLNLAGALTGKLSRLHVTGRWDDRRSLRIRQEPLRNLSEGTIDFLRQAVRGGGRLGQDLSESLRQLVP